MAKRPIMAKIVLNKFVQNNKLRDVLLGTGYKIEDEEINHYNNIK
jgi:predicted NAD-dependent protein-ADP-ribosyltransferase YbiA (DUF1768 family)